ncbi:MAG TPA: FAD-dependent oxidoreductase [Hyphomicrobiaceae bacterium]|jgi:2-polyprenyl-6-methoxyphenol hydroxylase-like FAD-dependent oxidoreductase|nr:FAD-dependent oxidoreductase [Hyphomicrobiaceae bacterium]
MAEQASVQCCIAGGGPAGMVAGLLLARAGCRVTVLEKHADFLRDFRGDTIHPSTMAIMHELGLLERLLALPHQKVVHLSGTFGGETIPFADFSHLPGPAPFIALMPQWDFLDFLAGEAKRYPGFRLLMCAEATGLVEEQGRVAGVRFREPDGAGEIHAPLVIAADGRHSTLRAAAGLEVRDLGAPMDVLWFRLSRRPQDSAETMGRFLPGTIVVTLNRGDYWQCAFVIPKGGIEAVKAAGLPALRERIGRVLPFGADRAEEIDSWDKVKLLTVTVDRLTTWYRPGLLCIGDAAHAMSPIGGVGINLAVQDAVAMANLLHTAIRDNRVTTADLAAVQRRRLFPTRVIQRLQLVIQNNVVAPTLSTERPLRAPWPVRLLSKWPLLQRIPARVLGLGIRPEHVAADLRAAEPR